MPTIYEISEKYRVSIRKLRRMHKDGLLRCENSGDPIADDIRMYLNAGTHLTVKQLVALIERPALLLEIGPKIDQAQAYIEALGSPEPAPDDLWPELAGAAANDSESLAKLVKWAKSVIPPDKRISHHWLAVRLMLSVPDNLRTYEFPRLNRVFLNMRKSSDFTGWWTVEDIGKRRVTWYHQPENFDF